MKRISLDGVELCVEDRGDGPPLLLVHGFPLDRSMWRAQIDELSSRCRTIAPDLRGFGQSRPAAGGVLTMEQLADDMAALLDALEINEPVCFCGLSMGGYVAWQFWRRHVDRLGKLILCDTRAAGDSEQAASDRLAIAERVTTEGAAIVVDAMMPRLFAESSVQQHPEIYEATRQVMLATPTETIAAAQRGMAQREDVTGRLSQINVPTLVVCGERDAISPADEMRQIAAAIPKARYEEIPAVGHMAPLENPPEVNAAISDFLFAE